MFQNVARHWLPLLLYMALIVVVSSMPRPPNPGLDWEHIDKVYHALEYAVLGLLAFRAFDWSLSQRGVRLPLLLIVTLLFCAGFGVTDEFHQRFVEMRQSSTGDLGADCVGAILGIGLAYAWKRRHMPHK